jgi:hypothetical protein
MFAFSVILYRVIRPRPGDAGVYVNAIGIGYSLPPTKKAAAELAGRVRLARRLPPSDTALFVWNGWCISRS